MHVERTDNLIAGFQGNAELGTGLGQQGVEVVDVALGDVVDHHRFFGGQGLPHNGSRTHGKAVPAGFELASGFAGRFFHIGILPAFVEQEHRSVVEVEAFAHQVDGFVQQFLQVEGAAGIAGDF